METINELPEQPGPQKRQELDMAAFERHLDASLRAFRQQLLNGCAPERIVPSPYFGREMPMPNLAPPTPMSPSLQPVLVAPDNTPHTFSVEVPMDQPEPTSPEEELAVDSAPVEQGRQSVSSLASNVEEEMRASLLKSGLQGLSPKEVESVKNRLRLRLGILSSKQLISGKMLMDAVAALGLTKYTEDDMNDFVNLLGEFIGLQFVTVQKRGSETSLVSFNSWFSFQESVASDLTKLGKPTWSWPTQGEPSRSKSNERITVKRVAVEYDCVPAPPLLEIFLSRETEVHRRIFGSKLNQYRAMREILLAGDTNRLVAELTFVRINDLAAPPEPMHPIMFLEPIVAVLIVANGVMIGFQTDPQYRDWDGWIYIESVFALFLVLEILLRMCVLGCPGYWCGSERWWNWFDIFLMTTGVSDILIHVAGAASDIAGTSLLRFCRLIRLVRIVKVFRVKVMRDLRLMVKGLVAGIRTLSLAFILLFAVLYVIGGFATMTIGSAERTGAVGLGGYFDNIPQSMFTAFRCFTGECISDDGFPLHSLLATEYGILFICGYVASYMLVTMGIFNVILAVYVDITMKAAKENDAVSAEQHARESIRVARTTRELLKIFTAAYHSFQDHNTMDEEPLKTPSAATFEDGMHDQVAITKELFLLVIQDRHVQKLMDDLDLPPDRANLFEMLDADGSGTLQTTELLQGLLKVRGEVNKSDTVASLLATKAVQGLVFEMKEQNAKLLRAVQESNGEMKWLRSEIHSIVKAANMIHHHGRDGLSSASTPAPPSQQKIARGNKISVKAFHVGVPMQPGLPELTESEISPPG